MKDHDAHPDFSKSADADGKEFFFKPWTFIFCFPKWTSVMI